MALKTKQLECSFTWEIEKQWALDYDEVKEPTIQFEDEPLLVWISSIMITYIRAEKEEFNEGFCNIKVTDDIWEKLDKGKLESIGVSPEILLHIKTATEYFLYDLAKYDSKADHKLQSLKSSELFQSDYEVATIDGCKSVAWSCFHEKGQKKSAEFAKLASLKSPNCSLWHYILGKSLRLSRREKFRNFTTLHEEHAAFIRMHEEMKKVECPFTWEIDKKLSKEFEESEELVVDVEEEPLFAFITLITRTYFEAENNNLKAIEKLDTLDNYWAKLDESFLNNLGVSARVLFHIKEATKYYIHKSTDRESDAKNILNSLEDAGNFSSPAELATINGCKSVVWSNFHEKANRQVTELAKLAIAGTPDCPLWHYILSKGLRHARRYDYGIDQPSDEEEKSVLQSCQLSGTPFYKIRLAQMYREQKKLDEAKVLYLEIYEADPKGQEILLRLARAFTSFREFDKAEVCFEKVAEYADNTMYHHYKGIFFIKIKEYRKAAFHFREAARRDNYRADLMYAWCLNKVNKHFDFIAHLKTMLKKYTKIPKYEQQTLLHIAMHYYNKNDLKNTLTYLLKAIEFDPQSRQLKVYTNTTLNWDLLNIYDFTNERLQEFQNQGKMMKEMKDTVEMLQDYCHEYRKRNPQDFLIE